MFGTWRPRRSDVARARLRALTPSWVPTPELVAQAFATDHASQVRGPQTAGHEPGVAGPAPEGPDLTSSLPVGVGNAAPNVDVFDPPRLGIDRSAARGLVALALGTLFGAGLVLLLGWPRGDAAPTSVEPPTISVGSSAGAAQLPAADMSPTKAPGVVVVDVAGKVRKPGVIELPAGSRVIDAIEVAGGVSGHGDTSGLNLAQVLVDGEQVMVSAQQPETTSGLPTTSAVPGSSPVNINTATLDQLDTLPGIGPVLAQAIIDWRTQNGSFTAVEQLQEVSGIGDATYADLAPLVRV